MLDLKAMGANGLHQGAIQVLKDNILPEERGGYTAASGRIQLKGEEKPHFLYPFQWLWDTFFIAGWSEDVDQSKTDVKNFLAAQTPEGFLGHIRYNRAILARREYFPPPNLYFYGGVLPRRGKLASKITQPPNAGWGLNLLAKKLPETAANRKFLKESFNAVFRYHRYIYQNLVKDGLWVLLHPWESGMDNSPSWDRVYEPIEKKKQLQKEVTAWLKKLDVPYERADLKLVPASQRPTDPHYALYLYLLHLYAEWGWDRRIIMNRSPFKVQDPLGNSVLIRANLSLAELGERIGAEEEKITQLKSWAQETARGLEALWDEKAGLYFPKNLANVKLLGVETVSSYIPLFSGAIPKEKASRLAKGIETLKKERNIRYLLPSTSPHEKTFDPQSYWRGPVWPITNELIAEGLELYGFKSLAKEIRKDTLKLVEKNLKDRGGFFECYHPQTGEGLGSPHQSWTAATVLKILSRV